MTNLADSSDRARPSTWWPALINARITGVPMKPEAPVTNTFMVLILLIRVQSYISMPPGDKDIYHHFYLLSYCLRAPDAAKCFAGHPEVGCNHMQRHTRIYISMVFYKIFILFFGR